MSDSLTSEEMVSKADRFPPKIKDSPCELIFKILKFRKFRNIHFEKNTPRYRYDRNPNHSLSLNASPDLNSSLNSNLCLSPNLFLKSESLTPCVSVKPSP